MVQNARGQRTVVGVDCLLECVSGDRTQVGRLRGKSLYLLPQLSGPDLITA